MLLNYGFVEKKRYSHFYCRFHFHFRPPTPFWLASILVVFRLRLAFNYIATHFQYHLFPLASANGTPKKRYFAKK